MSRPPPPLEAASHPSPSGIRAAPPLRGAASTSHLEQGTKHAIRGKDQLKRSSSLRTVDLDETSSLSVQQQLAEILTKEAVRVIDLFREWDEDGNGVVSRKEFRKAMPLLGLQVPRPDVDALFDSWDPDGSGELSLRELSQRLKRRVEAPTSPTRRPRRRYEHGMSAIGRQPLSGRENPAGVKFGTSASREPLNSRPIVAGCMMPGYQATLEFDRPAPNRYDLGLDRPLQQRWAGRKGANGVSFGKGTREVGSPFHVKAIGPGPARYTVDQEIGMPDPNSRSRTPSAFSVTGKWSYHGSLEMRSTRIPGPNLKPISSFGRQYMRSHCKTATAYSFQRGPNRVILAPGTMPKGPGMLLPARTPARDVTPGPIYIGA